MHGVPETDRGNTGGDDAGPRLELLVVLGDHRPHGVPDEGGGVLRGRLQVGDRDRLGEGDPDPAGQVILPERISKDSFGPVVRDGDDQWFNIVRWTLFTLIDAEEVGLTQANFGSLMATKTPEIRRMLDLDGTFGRGMGLSPDFMKNIIAGVGNYGEIFDRNFGPNTGVPMLRGQNALWTRGGLLFAPPIE